MTLTAPAHITGYMPGGSAPHVVQRAHDRLAWIEQALAAGHSTEAIAAALDIRVQTLKDLMRRARREGLLSKPEVAPPTPVAAPRGISLHRAPWEVETGHDPRHETTPRLPPIRSPRRRVSVKSVIDVIRAEVNA
ncbi:helix-turn-helix domain-containing protein [Paracoccus sp. DMF-8]|uniref:helix-turn-helix domain-containing protein n=1 Tax=Paracoccus sp. DMF-8 TaxID=3019445 RepID=UPI0023E46BC9|nr:helix-turn-helix domain-containing protein [Paracoccus sp. DMF-8]MDF3607537.1 helix-turn-helix domain-containing protein [Paracoccus sp. DMF-8]